MPEHITERAMKNPLLLNESQTGLPVRSTPYVDVPRPLPPDKPENGAEYWHMVRRRKGVFILIALAGLLAAVVVTLPQTPVYQARTVLEIRGVNENFLNMRNVSPTDTEGGVNSLETELQTQVNILQSESVLRAVIDRLDLASRIPAEKDQTRLAAWRKFLRLPEPKPASSGDGLLHLLAANLRVKAQANTRLLEVTYDSPDPRLAAEIADAVTAEFIRLNVQSRWQSTRQTGEWLTEQMEEVRINLEKSERRLQDYANTSGILFTAEKDNVAEEKLKQLQQELSRAQADRVTHQSKYELASTASPESLPEVLDDATLKDYQVKLTDLRRQLAELTATLTPSHPSVKKVQAQVSTLEAALEKERANVTRRIQNEFESAQRRERLLTAGYDSQARLVAEQSTKVTHYNILKREVDNNRQLYDSMLQHVREAGISSALRASNVRIIDSARPPERPYKPNLPLNMVIGLFTGAFLAFVFVVLRERADRSIRSPGEASRYLDVPELGVIPSAQAERSHKFAYYRQSRTKDTPEREKVESPARVELVTWQNRPSVLAESFRSTVASILYAGENGNRPRVIVVTSANPQEGKTTVASNLALALAEIGRRVLVVDADLRRPRLHEIFKVPNVFGLSDLLEAKEPLAASEPLAIATAYRDLSVLPAGPAPSNISNLLHSPQMLESLKRMRQDFDMVIIDTPPMLQMPDARVLGRLADGVILVVRSNRTTKDNFVGAGQRLAEDRTRVLGTVLNEWDPRHTGHTAYDYGYGQYGYREGRQSGDSASAA